MRNSGTMRTVVTGMLLLSAVCGLRSLGIAAGDGAVLNGMHRGAAALRTRPDTTRAGLLRAARVPRPESGKWSIPPVDVRALSAAEPRGASEHAPAPAPQGGPRAALPVVLAAVLAAACSTALILFFVARATLRRSPAPAPVARLVQPAECAPVENDGAASSAEPAVPASGDEDGFFGVGRDLRAARGEMALAMRLHSGAMGDGARRSARGACSLDATTAERVKVARRLGIGRGEIDLALRLRKLESSLSGEGKTA